MYRMITTFLLIHLIASQTQAGNPITLLKAGGRAALRKGGSSTARHGAKQLTKQAIATAATIGFPLALASSLGFVVTGLDESGLPPLSLGYVNLPAFGGVVAASILFAPLGARLAHQLPDKLLKRVFAVFLFLLALRMAYALLIKP